jgi:hypothetical protein
MVTVAWQPNWAFHKHKSLEWGIKLGVTDCVQCSIVGRGAIYRDLVRPASSRTQNHQ